MSHPELLLPVLVEPDALESALNTDGLLVVDLGRPDVYAQGHVPGAVRLDYSNLVSSRPPVGGLLPDPDQLGAALSGIGLSPETHVVAYDDEGGGKAGRFLFTLDAIGHSRFSLLNGGLHAWANEGHPTENVAVRPVPSDYVVSGEFEHCADKDFILANLDNPDVVLLDARTPEEYSGAVRRSARGGHIPGAVNMNWVLAMDQQRNLRLRTETELRELLQERGVTSDKEVVVYCQTHHRSSHTYAVLKSLGYTRLRGYPGAWSEWGNLQDTPVE
jgi:thiosulfate/3-mercaptopyruvate sulfurtransferase